MHEGRSWGTAEASHIKWEQVNEGRSWATWSCRRSWGTAEVGIRATGRRKAGRMDAGRCMSAGGELPPYSPALGLVPPAHFNHQRIHFWRDTHI